MTKAPALDVRPMTKAPALEVRTECPACKSSSFTDIYDVPYDRNPVRNYLIEYYQDRIDLYPLKNGRFALSECSNCECTFQKFVPNAELSHIIYSKWLGTDWHLERAKEHNIEVDAYTATEIMQIISFLGRPSHELRVLDFGMGWGRWLLMARAFGIQVYGTELGDPQLEEARRNGITTLNWDELPGREFDFINTDHVFEHLTNPLDTLEHLHRALRPGGFIKIAVPTARNIRALLKEPDWRKENWETSLVMPIGPLEHLNVFQVRTVEVMAGIGSLEIYRAPLVPQYIYSSAWHSARNVAKNIMLPFLRRAGLRNYFLLKAI